MRKIEGVTLFGRPVSHPAIAIPLAVAVSGGTLMMLPVWLPLHFVLKAFGCRGFIIREPAPTIDLFDRETRTVTRIVFDRSSFRRS